MLSRGDPGAPLWLPYDSMVFTTSRPLLTWPNTCVGTRYSAPIKCTVWHCCMQARTLFTDIEQTTSQQTSQKTTCSGSRDAQKQLVHWRATRATLQPSRRLASSLLLAAVARGAPRACHPATRSWRCTGRTASHWCWGPRWPSTGCLNAPTISTIRACPMVRAHSSKKLAAHNSSRAHALQHPRTWPGVLQLEVLVRKLHAWTPATNSLPVNIREIKSR